MTKQENEERLARLKNIVLSMPEKQGSYQYYDENHTIIYVGKAKNRKRRVSSYFHKEVDRYKTKVLVSKIQALLPLASHIALVTLSLQLNCAIVPLIVTRPMIGTIPFLSFLPFT